MNLIRQYGPKTAPEVPEVRSMDVKPDVRLKNQPRSLPVMVSRSIMIPRHNTPYLPCGFTVVAGRIEGDGVENHKYIGERVLDFELALKDFQANQGPGYHFVRIEYRDHSGKIFDVTPTLKERL